MHLNFDLCGEMALGSAKKDSPFAIRSTIVTKDSLLHCHIYCALLETMFTSKRHSNLGHILHRFTDIAVFLLMTSRLFHPNFGACSRWTR